MSHPAARLLAVLRTLLTTAQTLWGGAKLGQGRQQRTRQPHLRPPSSMEEVERLGVHVHSYAMARGAYNRQRLLYLERNIISTCRRQAKHNRGWLAAYTTVPNNRDSTDLGKAQDAIFETEREIGRVHV